MFREYKDLFNGKGYCCLGDYGKTKIDPKKD